MLEVLAPRALLDMPLPVLDDMESSEVSFFAVVAQKNELRTRMQMTDVVNRRSYAARAHGQHRAPYHARSGMRADFHKVDEPQREGVGNRDRSRTKFARVRQQALTSWPT